jgi:hypothetical protein
MSEALRSLLGGRVIPLHTTLARVFDDIPAALFLAQLAYWLERDAGDDSWVQLSDSQIADETTITAKQMARIRKVGQRLGVFASERRGNPARMFYKIDWVVLAQLLPSVTTSSSKSGSTVVTEGRLLLLEKPSEEHIGAVSNMEILRGENAPDWLRELRQIDGYNLDSSQEARLNFRLDDRGITESRRFQTALALQDKWPRLKRSPTRPKGYVDLARTMRNWCEKGASNEKSPKSLGKIQDGRRSTTSRKLVSTRTIK